MTFYNPILDSDSYKFSHHMQYAPRMTGMYSYLESRGGKYDKTVFFGLQYLIREYLENPPTQAHLEEADAFCKLHGVPFPRKGWQRIVDLGYYPIKIKAVPEGFAVPTHNILMSVECVDPECFWVVAWLETMIMRLWYPITVATQSWYCKKTILEHLMLSSDNPEAEINFKLHDFGSRGVSSRESAGIGGMAHLVNFRGSDTVEGVIYANQYYECEMAGFSIPAAEHSTITSWGQDNEEAAYRNMVRQFGTAGATVAVVSDSYDLFNAIEKFWCGSLLAEVKASGATIVIRPDSGNPAEIILKCLQLMEKHLPMPRNSKGYKVLPSYYRLIQGDGVNQESIDEILCLIEEHGYSASNVAFGMGGALLQKVDRDTQKFAMKCSAALIDNVWRDVYKDPVTDTGKRSKRGKLELIYTGVYSTVREYSIAACDELLTVYYDGYVVEGNETTLATVRTFAHRDLLQEISNEPR